MTRPRVPRVVRAAERAPSYGAATTRYNLIVPADLKREIDEEAARRGASGPELARRLLEGGLRRLREEALWQRLREAAPKTAARDRAVVEWWDRWEQAWERSDAASRRRH
jgi:hypothetical protein